MADGGPTAGAFAAAGAGRGASAAGAWRERIDALCASVTAPDRHSARLAQVRQLALARPSGSLGRLDTLVQRVAGIRRTASPGPLDTVVSVLAGDHGVAAHGTSRFRPGVTGRVLRLIDSGQAPVNILADRLPARVETADFGLVDPVGDQRYKIAPGTADISVRDAMTADLAVRAVAAGARFAEERLGGAGLVAIGEIGVGNTTAATALAARLLGRTATELTGLGSGVPQDTVRQKAALVGLALDRTAHLPDDPLTVLAALGGYEIAGNTGIVLAAAARRQVVLVDGAITAVAALLAVRLCPAVAGYLIAAHESTEPSHRHVLEALGQPPLLRLEMRLGMASGAALAAGLVNAALAVAELTPGAAVAGLAEAQ
ncbi:nicotinate-nucleotide--dimethylbenzimidazole phosphoribosyltransferase [Streptomyces sp. BE20]|uniref:nicotinate-nucleotide--dimethylbenzimidazole phosphoribosyltransferase n=1 Tax=Streptomyces sp. BE20 TaxID=3002525 RepID=UPI002E79F8B1|nr:nicotinate-nucleotide--dimethylbenzimidazole phosphoribosyltransferase [Streptomyces sp. BE20]MEE1822819.1 nicotinate-nucleotide--dimethylbenzimidazole phosphoribosyltransferase [Streptomyces sp. BE20]